MNKFGFIISIVIIISACCQNDSKSELKSNSIKDIPEQKSLIKIDTIKYNDNISYTVGFDTIVKDLQISTFNKNIENRYVVQSYFLDDSTVILNHYPELESTIEIYKGPNLFFKQNFTKHDFPENPMSKYLSQSILKDISFYNYDDSTGILRFRTSLNVPNTDFIYDYEISITPQARMQIRFIDYEGEE